MLKSLNLIVIRGESPEILANHYARLGIKFIKEQHGNGPIHYSSNLNGAVFEIYPGIPSGHVVGGFGVDSIDDFIELCKILNIEYKKVGNSVIIKDPAGNKFLIG